MNNQTILKILVIFAISFSLTGCGDRRGNSNNNGAANDFVDIVTTPSINYNLYIENSGSMRGYFSGKSSLKTILKEYHDRIVENFNADDDITLNYINTKIEQSNGGINDFLIKAESKCNASYSKLGDILAMSMDGLEDNQVNILVSDFGFTTDNNLAIGTAQSEITKLFRERINKDENLSIAILKYDCDFNGLYYPGGISCKHSLPIYIWVFGTSECVKNITNLPIKELHENMTLQPWVELQPKYEVKVSRMLDKKSNSIVVKEWKQDRYKEMYKLGFTVDMSSVLFNEDFLTNIGNYHISDGYSIDDVSRLDGSDIYSFNISTGGRPSPGNVEISLNRFLPEWVEESNFSGTGVPPEGKTQNVRYLIEGAYDAYWDKSNKYLTINLNLK